MKSTAKGKAQKNKSKQTLADKADKFDCYQKSVQEPEHEVDIFIQAYKEAYNRKPLKLREDFCGTFAVCCSWVESDAKRSAWGVDLCDETLQWGKDNNLSKLKQKEAKRVTVLEQDVREFNTPQADVLAAQNFSFWIFKTREEVIEYFKIARANLASEGVIVMDMMGGRDCYDSDIIDKRTIVKGKKGFKYHWEQAYFNPVNSDCIFYIHFKFADGSKMKKAFRYDWRFWTIPEVREMLLEAGFRDTVVYWEEDDDDDDADAVWSRVEEAPNDYSWLCYVVGIK
ncbi:MAG: class I SAM-dependent methyltransferase [Gammaproteobacteria bacterium]|nr:class I SAM-dependent methyltransferase [Gammaproteobacteria bacterium]MDD9895431.1 class I SAM-dependent methyltransferase [Gammaproteobacteria bacterium]MDD9957553.1 class I SAM-dependent methyltransferase [Gammaproteobacteria bacterium]